MNDREFLLTIRKFVIDLMSYPLYVGLKKIEFIFFSPVRPSDMLFLITSLSIFKKISIIESNLRFFTKKHFTSFPRRSESIGKRA